MSCGVGHRCGSDIALLWLWLWLWCRPAAVALIIPLAWKPPYTECSPKKQKQNKTKQNKKKPNNPFLFVLWKYNIVSQVYMKKQ